MSLPRSICEAASSKNDFAVNEGTLKKGGNIHRARAEEEEKREDRWKNGAERKRREYGGRDSRS